MIVRKPLEITELCVPAQGGLLSASLKGGIIVCTYVVIWGEEPLLCLHLTSLSQNPKLAENAFKYTLLPNGIKTPLSLV